MESPTATENAVGRSTEFNIIWKNLTYKVDSRPWVQRIKDGCMLGCTPSNHSQSKGERIVLDKICGAIKSRQLTGILGPSGAGKTSLLRCLFHNHNVGTTGHVVVEGLKDKLKVCSISQKDYLNEYLTAREDLIYVSKLRATEGSMSNSSGDDKANLEFNLASSSPIVGHNANAIRIADSLGLSGCLDVLIKNLSGGQKKRLSIARELMAQPDVLLLDEPTTGLDSVTCYKTMLLLQDLAHHSERPMAVVVTIHQPPKNVFNLFDKTYIITNTGAVIYDDVPGNVTRRLEDVARTNLPTANYNPASAMIEIASDNTRKAIIDRLSHYQRQTFDNMYTPSHINRLIDSKDSNRFHTAELSIPGIRIDDIALGSIDADSYPPGQIISEEKDYSMSPKLGDSLSSHSFGYKQSLRHILLLTHRSWLSILRNPSLTKARLMFYTMTPIIIFMLYGTESAKANGCPNFNASFDLDTLRSSIDQNSVYQNVEMVSLTYQNLSMILILLYALGMNIITLSTTQYSLTMHIFKKEAINGLYSTNSYFIAQMIAYFPFEIVYPFSSIILTYLLTGQTSSFLEWRMLAIAANACLWCYTAYSFGLLVGSVFINNTILALAGGQIFLSFSIMLSGLIVRVQRMPYWMQALSYLSHYKHGLSAIMAARYGFNVCDCDEDILQNEDMVLDAWQVPENVRNVVEYLFPKNDTDGISVVEMLDKMNDRIVETQSYGKGIKTCEDVRPAILNHFKFEDSDLYLGPLFLMAQIIILNLLIYYSVKALPYRVK